MHSECTADARLMHKSYPRRLSRGRTTIEGIKGIDYGLGYKICGQLVEKIRELVERFLWLV